MCHRHNGITIYGLKANKEISTPPMLSYGSIILFAIFKGPTDEKVRMAHQALNLVLIQHTVFLIH